MPAKKAKTKSKKAPSPAQLRARKAFAAAAKARSKTAKGNKRASRNPLIPGEGKTQLGSIIEDMQRQRRELVRQLALNFGAKRKASIKRQIQNIDTYLAKVKNPAKRARNKTIITKPKKVIVLNGRKKAAKRPTRRRNLDHRDAAHPIEVSRYWQGRKGYLTPWQRAHKAGQQGLFDHGIKARNGGGFKVVATPKRKSWAGEKPIEFLFSGSTKAAAIKAGQQAIKEQGGSLSYYKFSAVAQNPKGRATKKASPKARAIRKSFTGLSANKTTAMHVPQGTPVNLAKLGRLVSIKTDKGVINPAKGATLVLCSDTKGRLHIASTKKPGVRNPAHKQTFGEVKEIEYETAKPHLGYKKSTIFFHKMGEEGGRKPTLFSDGQYLRLRGGSYKITPRGIVN